ncbi:MAG: tetraacyldisaccharide 4'-kinase [Ferruginibacter sp.]|nr:tetraacyldisaccharide 4'-kinase [Ferruginibacter sp.]
MIWLRNKLFDWKIIRSAAFNFPLICVGNLAVGGTGKTPMTEYLIELLKDEFKTATLSRGYKRKTKGFGIADNTTSAVEIGDEPMQFHQKYPDITVAVGEERLVAIPQILHVKPDTEVIILDDAFQHRYIRPGFNIVLTEYKNLYTRDFLLPVGDLRDIKSSIKRAQVIIVSKCSENISVSEKENIIKELSPRNGQSVFFTKITYGNPYHLYKKDQISLDLNLYVLLISGIANPKPLKDLLNNTVSTYDMIKYRDHHIFNTDDLKEIKNSFDRIKTTHKILLTTEKDAVRLEKFKDELIDYPIYVIPVRHEFLFDEKYAFDEKVKKFVSIYHTH